MFAFLVGVIPESFNEFSIQKKSECNISLVLLVKRVILTALNISKNFNGNINLK